MLEQWPRCYLRVSIFVNKRVIHQVARHEVDSAFDTLATATERTADGTQKRGLPHADVALKHDLTAAERRDVEQS